jgi:hypothetical protein
MLTVVPVEKRPAAWRESYFGIGKVRLTIEVYIAFDNRIFPDRVPRATALPCYHRVGIGPRTG